MMIIIIIITIIATTTMIITISPEYGFTASRLLDVSMLLWSMQSAA